MPGHEKPRRLSTICVATFVAVFSVSPMMASAEAYKPLFDERMLQSLDPATRERFATLERENHRRWRNRNPQAPDVTATQRQHEQTQAMLRRFEESRRLAEMAKSEGDRRSADQKQKCETVAAEIKELSAGGVFYENDADGNRRYLSDKEVASRVKNQQKSYNKYCRS